MPVARYARFWGRFVCVTTLGVGAALIAAPAVAYDDTVRGYSADITLAPDGRARVVLDLDMDLGVEPNRGPYLSYMVRQRFDDTHDRAYPIPHVLASSETAPAKVQRSEKGGWLDLRIGDPDRRDLVGRHTYRVRYVVDGLVNSADVFGLPDDELFLDVIGDRWEIPLENLSVTVRGPAGVTAARCHTGTGQTCGAAEVTDGAAHFTQDALDPGQTWTVAVAFPAGTFGGVEPILQERWTWTRALGLTPTTGTWTAVATALGLGGVAMIGRRLGGDEEYAALTPGLAPTSGARPPRSAAGAVRRRRLLSRRRPVAVRFTPPEGLPPGLVGTVVDGRADARDITATLIDLAVRGYVTIEEDGAGGRPDWSLRRTDHDPERTGLLPFEETVLSRVFQGRRPVQMSDLKGSGVGRTIATAMYGEATDLGWFRRHPQPVREGWSLLGMYVLVASALTLLITFQSGSSPLPAVPTAVVGATMVFTPRRLTARSAEGTAVQTQAEGFRHYLATAEADQLRFEEQQDVFSRYLPYAIAFGVAERWARLAAGALAVGATAPQPSWYAGPTPFWATGGLGAGVSGFTRLAGSGLTPGSASSASSGSSGGSGFSGGGASSGSGGGAGGSGGGTW